MTFSKAIISAHRALRPLFFIALFALVFSGTAEAAEYISDRVWYDLNKNGIQDAGEPGVAGVNVRIGWRNFTTDANGYYISNDLRGGRSYTVTFSNLPAGWVFTSQDVGSDDDIDSDVDPVTGAVSVTAITNVTITNVDAGIIFPVPEIDVKGNGVSIYDGDTSPSATDDTYFGSADIVTGLVDHTFTIQNSGDRILELEGSPLVAISGTHASDFTVTSQPSVSTINANGGSETFVISFDPSAEGLRSATVTIESDDDDEDPYTFSILGNGTATPEIDITGDGQSIPDGSTSPSTADNTDFGDADIYGGANTNTFTISNSGSGVLNLTGSPLVQISGAHAGDFTVSSQPSSSAVATLGGTETFQITFDPSVTGLRQASVSISSDDANESPYTFDIQGTGTINPEIDIQGNNVSIADGETATGTSDSTYFGTVQVGGSPHFISYTIYNTGPATLNFTGAWPLVGISGSQSADFSVQTPPASSVAPGGNTSFVIKFDPIADGDRTATLTIENNDLNEGSYSFNIRGTGQYVTAPLSEINLRSGAINIVSGTNTPNTSDGTDFGSVLLEGAVTTETNTFTIDNLGTEDLLLTSNPFISVGGSHASDFTISQQPSSPVAPGGSVTFNVTFEPSAVGTRTAYLIIDNNDSDEDPYTINLQGTGAASPEIEVTGNGLEIVNGDNTPHLSDSTFVGNVVASLGVGYVTFTINNLGSSSLQVSSIQISGDTPPSGTDPDFVVVSPTTLNIPASGSADLVIKFDPWQIGDRDGAVSIYSTDADENPYVFAIRGSGTGPGSPISCVPNFFHIYGDEGTVAYLDATTNPYTYTTITTAGYSINGMGYNLQDGLIYGFEMDNDIPGDNIIRIDGQGTISVVNSDPVPLASWRADFNESGELYFWDANGQNIYIFDAATGSISNAIPRTGTTDWTPIDMAFIHGPDKFYGVMGETLFEYDPTNHAVTTETIDGRLADEYATGTNSQYYGACWSAFDGYLYTTNSQSGRMYKINVTPDGTTGNCRSVYVGQGAANLNKSDGASCPLADAPLPQTASIGNDVWIDADDDGIQDASETGLPGVLVELFTVDGSYNATTISDENGNYSFTNLAPSEYYMIFSGAPTGFSPTAQDIGTNDLLDSDIDETTGRTPNFTVDIGLLDEGIDAGYVTTGVGNFVWDDLDEDGVQDFGEPGIPGITLSLYDGNTSLNTTTVSDANGFYVFSGIPTNADRIRVSNLPGGYIITDRNQGGDDDLDSDVSTTSPFQSDAFNLTSGEFTGNVDVGIHFDNSVVEAEINVQGNGVDIADGDTSPSASDDTEFGSVSEASGSATQTYTVQNVAPGGSADLSLNGSPLIIEVLGTHASDFTVTAQPSTTITAGSSTTFDVTFDPSAGGLRSAYLSITNNDSNENPYDFNIQGTGLSPEIEISGDGNVIADGDTTASTEDFTDLGGADIANGVNTATFQIENTGTATLNITGSSPYITFSGDDAADFSVHTPPATTIAASATTTFVIAFNPSSEGEKNATLSIANSDVDENPYTFAIKGTGTSFPEMGVVGNLQDISNGDTSPSSSDFTDFGSRDVNGESRTYTFTIENTGSGSLDLTGSPKVQIYGANAGDFIITQQPNSPVAALTGTTTFSVKFDPTTTGIRNATISIPNSDTNENPYNFSIKGLGTSTLDEEMEVLGNGLVIESGDITPQSADFTDMGIAEISGVPGTSAFTIRNIGYAVLHLTGPPPYVSIGGLNADEFVVTSTPSNSIAIDSAFTTFEIGFNPAALGVREAIISIQNDDADENPYTFKVQGTGIYNPNSQSEINVTGNLQNIANGDMVPSFTDSTDFGSVEVVGGFSESNEFVVHNLGSEDLVLGDTPAITIAGDHPGDFSVTSAPPSLVAPNSTVSFIVKFDPSSTGVRSAIISIGNSDQDENPYTFKVQGEGTIAPEISVEGNGVVIASGDQTPGTADSTDFGDIDVSLGIKRITYTIENTGSANLTLDPIVVSGDADFSVTSAPTSPVTLGSSTTFVVTFDAIAVGTRSATISIGSNDPETPTYTFDVEGGGTGAGSPFSCSPGFFRVYGSGGTIAYLDATSSPYTYTVLGTAGYEIDGIGYNQQDGLIYGFEHNDSGWPRPENMVRIDATGSVTILDAVDYDFASRIADFDNNGNYYFWNDAGTDVRRFVASTGTFTNIADPGGTFASQDMAFRAADSKFYGVHDSTLYVYDPIGNTLGSSVKIRGKLQDDLVAGTNGDAIGAAWTASDGYLYVANENSGRMYRIDVTVSPAISVFVGESPALGGDGASCAASASPLPTTGTIGNFVWLDNDGDGIQDAGEEGLDSVTVSLYEVGNDASPLSTTLSGSDGSYSFGSLAAGSYYLTFTTPPTGFSLSPQDAGGDDALDSDVNTTTFKTPNIDITPGVVDNSVDAGFRATGVGDYVWLDANEDGLQAGNENGVPGISVAIRIDGQGTDLATTTTDANGAYSFTGLSPNTYRVYFNSLPIGFDYTTQDQGSDDAIDSDANGSGQTAAFTLSANQYINNLDAGVFQSSEPEISVSGNSTNITDGDTSPSTTDSTDFGTMNAATDSLLVTYVIDNAISGATLTLNGSPRVSIIGDAAADFTVVSQPSETIAAGSNSSFVVKFLPIAEGLRTATVSIANTDADENPFNFAIRGFGLASEITVEGNGHVINDGDSTATATDFTDFGSEDILTGSQSQIFTILNTGNANLELTGPDPYITLTGDHAGDFSVTNSPLPTVGSNSTTSFTITFDPVAEGLRTAVVSIANNDLDENPFTFTIQGIGLASPEITVEANGEVIGDGDVTPIVTDNTDFGSRDILTDTQTHTFSIINSGSGTLNLTDDPVVVLAGAQAGDFLVSSQPNDIDLSPGDTVTFDITFNPTAVGLRSASVIIANDDDDENPFNFNIQGTGVASSDLEVTCTTRSFIDVEGTPLMSFDSTIVDTATSLTFTITNPGSAVLLLTGASPYILISGTHASDFVVTSLPVTSISAGGGTTQFAIRFTPSGEGDRTAVVTIPSDDPDSPYVFNITGFGLPTPQPELTLSVSVDLTVATPGDTLTYTVVYSNVGEGLATDVVVDQAIPDNATYAENSAAGAGMVITFQHEAGGGYDLSQTAPVTDIRWTRTSDLDSGGSGIVTFRVVVD